MMATVNTMFKVMPMRASTATRRVSLWFVLGSCLIHLFCCGIPLLLSLGSLGAVIGTGSMEWIHEGWFGRHEIDLMLASGAVLLVTGLVQFLSSRINCRTDGDCAHAPCDSKRSYARYVFLLAVGLYAINGAVFLLAH